MNNEIPDELKIQKSDIAVSALNSLIAALSTVNPIIPIVGPLLQEIVGYSIPNQRIDRIIKYSIRLEKKIKEIDESVLKLAFTDENFSDLMEESLIQVARSISEERREYIASLICNSLKPEKIGFIESKHLLKILGEINDIEVIWLRFYYCPLLNGDKEFREKHKNIIGFQRSYIDAPQNILNNSTIQESYQSHLVQLGLLAPNYETIQYDRLKQIPIADRFSGGLTISDYKITSLGVMVINQIDFGNDWKKKFPK